jgi:hypothetical protein
MSEPDALDNDTLENAAMFMIEEDTVMDDKTEKMSMPGATAGINVSQILTSVLKYLIEGLAIAIVAYALPQKKLKLDEVATIALVGAATFAILDMYAPGATADAARMGAGFGIGGNLVGFA